MMGVVIYLKPKIRQMSEVAILPGFGSGSEVRVALRSKIDRLRSATLERSERTLTNYHGNKTGTAIVQKEV